MVNVTCSAVYAVIIIIIISIFRTIFRPRWPLPIALRAYRLGAAVASPKFLPIENMPQITVQLHNVN